MQPTWQWRMWKEEPFDDARERAQKEQDAWRGGDEGTMLLLKWQRGQGGLMLMLVAVR